VRDYPPNIDPPGTVSPVLLASSSRCAIVNDAYPKATVHMLVLPLDVRLQSLNELTHSHVDLLLDMKRTANEFIAHSRIDATVSALPWTWPFAMGFHAIPSLPMLHMHVMTLDLHTSPRVKKRAHYNSFATRFFLPVDTVLADLRQNRFVPVNQDVKALHQLEKEAYRCLWCGSTAFTQLPALKEHIAGCNERRSCGGPSPSCGID
jgi:aprataxin